MPYVMIMGPTVEEVGLVVEAARLVDNPNIEAMEKVMDKIACEMCLNETPPNAMQDLLAAAYEPITN